MSVTSQSEWNPGAYGRFRDLRLRPAMDLMMGVSGVPAGTVVDLGCGAGVMGPALAQRFPGFDLIGVDNSAAMLSEAEETGAYYRLDQADIADWDAVGASLIFFNAALHWLKDHEVLLPRLARGLAPGGTLAVQVPHQNNAPSHRVWLSLVDELFPGALNHGAVPGILSPTEYYHLLAPFGHLTLWETDYYQVLPPCEDGHPVRRFTESTFARPVLDAVGAAGRDLLIAAYEGVMEKAYPRAKDGGVLFPFRRLFFTLTV